MDTTPPLRNRARYTIVALIFAALAFASRRYGDLLPPFVVRYAGDTLWATMVYFATGALATRRPASAVAAIAVVGSYAVEISQLYRAPWIDGIRATWLGGLVLGHGFLWSDIVCYTAGVALGAGLETAWRWAATRREVLSARA
jgi:hypothetical protein